MAAHPAQGNGGGGPRRFLAGWAEGAGVRLRFRARGPETTRYRECPPAQVVTHSKLPSGRNNKVIEVHRGEHLNDKDSRGHEE